MDEIVFYNSCGDPSDKQYSTSFGYLSSIHTSNQYSQYRQCYSNINASCLTGIGQGEKLIVACKGKALVHVYLYGKESPEQKIPVPEELTTLEICKDPINSNKSWLLIGGGVSGRLYVWELSSGLLLTVKEAHYQSVSVIKYSKGFLVSGGLDSRVVVWKILDLISSSNDYEDNNKKVIKPYCIITDNSLPITDLIITGGLITDLKLYTCSKDSTIRCYELISKQLISTFVAPFPVDSIACDPAYRSLYVGLSNGTIRMIPLYQTSTKTKILEHVGGNGKIITLKNDFELNETFISHQQNLNDGEECNITQLQVGFDGTTLISGDSKGRLFISDIITKQTNKRLKNLVGSISCLKLFKIELNSIKLSKNNNDKNIIRTIPVLKRVLVESTDLKKHEILIKLQGGNNNQIDSFENGNDFDMNSFLNQVQNEEKWFINYSNVDSTVNNKNNDNNNDDIIQLKEQLKKIQDENAELKAKVNK